MFILFCIQHELFSLKTHEKKLTETYMCRIVPSKFNVYQTIFF